MESAFTLTVTQITVVLGLSIGYLWGEAFSGFDGQLKYESKWFKKLNSFDKWVYESILDATHHFQYGLIIILYTMTRLTPGTIWYILFLNIGWGLIVSDGQDFNNILKRFNLTLTRINLPEEEGPID